VLTLVGQAQLYGDGIEVHQNHIAIGTDLFNRCVLKSTAYLFLDSRINTMSDFKQVTKRCPECRNADKLYHILLEEIGEVYVLDTGQRLLQLLVLGGFDAELHDVVVKFLEVENLLAHALVVAAQFGT